MIDRALQCEMTMLKETHTFRNDACATLDWIMKRSQFFIVSIFLLVVPGVIVFGQSSTGSSPARMIAVNYSDIKGKHRTFFSEVVGAGRAAEGLRADWQRDLDFVHRECGFKYIRFHGLLQDEMGVYSEHKNGQPIYNFQYVDALYDAILKIGMKPFVELSFMPRALASGGKTVFWWQGNTTLPKDYDKWERLSRALTQHWTERYGAEEVRQWYFEIWNEPNLDIFWSGDQATAPVLVAIRSLVGMDRLFLKSGEKRTVSFAINPTQTSVIDEQGRRIVEPGEFVISVGGKQPGFKGSADAETTGTLNGEFVISGTVTPIAER
jgi:hypothetical protein